MKINELTPIQLQFIQNLVKTKGDESCYEIKSCDKCVLRQVTSVQFHSEYPDDCSPNDAYTQARRLIAAYERYIEDILLDTKEKQDG